MKDKEEKNLQFVLRYYRHGKLETTKALNKITGHRQQNNQHRLWIYSSGIAAAILICIVSYTLLSRSDNNMISVTANAGITRHFLPDSTLAILSKGSTLEYDSDNYGKKSREVNMSGKVFFSVRRNEQSPFTATAMYAHVKVTVEDMMEQVKSIYPVSFVYYSSIKLNIPYSGKKPSMASLENSFETIFSNTDQMGDKR